MKKAYLLYLLAFLFFFSLSSCKDTDSESVVDFPVVENEKEISNVSYGNEPLQNYDIYLPKNRSASKTKVIVLIHGGGWIGGDKADMKSVYNYMKVAFPEYAVANVNYRLASFALQPFPMQIDDMKSIVAHLKKNNSEYGIMSEYAFVGVSAGAHLAMFYSYKHDAEKNVKVVVDVVGPTDFLHSSYTNSTNQETQQVALAMQLITGRSIQNEPFYFESISPKYAVSKSSAPTILFYAGMDNLVPFQQGEVLKQKLDEFSVENEYYFYPQDGHELSETTIADVLEKATVFIRKHLK